MGSNQAIAGPRRTAIGIAAAYGVVLGLVKRWQKGESIDHRTTETVCDYLATSRPTAVNLFWALDRMRNLSRDLWDIYFAGVSAIRPPHGPS